MVSKTPKPVKECEGCALNRSDYCIVFPHPALKWYRRNCEGYNNEELIARYGDHSDGLGAHARKAARQKDGKKNDQVEHPEDHTSFRKTKFPTGA
jgi:hypothetical protein